MIMLGLWPASSGNDCVTTNDGLALQAAIPMAMCSDQCASIPAQALSAVIVPLADVCIRNQACFALQVATPWQCAVAIAQAHPFHPDAVAFANALAEDEGEPSVAALQEIASSHADHDGKQHALGAMCF